MLGTLVASVLLAAPAVGDRLPGMTLRTLSGVPYSWRPGRVTVFSFCAFWCDTWKDQLPRVREALRITGGLPVDGATVSVDGRWTDRAKAAAAGTMLGDPGGGWTRSVGIDRVPYTLVVGPSGRILWATYGTVRTNSLVAAIQQAVEGKGESAGRIYLTFDDFPSNRGSDELLDVLRAEGVPATLFCIGSKVGSRSSLLKRAVREGHGVAIHSWIHDGDQPDLPRCVAAIRDACGVSATLYRPPGSERVFDLRGQPRPFPVDDPYDYTRPGQDELVRRILLGARPNAVIQLHAGVEETLRALPIIVAKIRERGYVFEVVR